MSGDASSTDNEVKLKFGVGDKLQGGQAVSMSPLC